MKLGLAERFIIAAVQQKLALEELDQIWAKHIGGPTQIPDFTAVIEKLLQSGLLYDSRDKNYQQVRKLIEKSRE